MELATAKGKKYALEQLKKRKKQNKDREKINNANLYAGDMMHYYCIICNQEMVLFENHSCPAPKLCVECQALKDKGWLD